MKDRERYEQFLAEAEELHEKVVKVDHQVWTMAQELESIKDAERAARANALLCSGLLGKLEWLLDRYELALRVDTNQYGTCRKQVIDEIHTLLRLSHHDYCPLYDGDTILRVDDGEVRLLFQDVDALVDTVKEQGLVVRVGREIEDLVATAQKRLREAEELQARANDIAALCGPRSESCSCKE